MCFFLIHSIHTHSQESPWWMTQLPEQCHRNENKPPHSSDDIQRSRPHTHARIHTHTHTHTVKPNKWHKLKRINMQRYRQKHTKTWWKTFSYTHKYIKANAWKDTDWHTHTYSKADIYRNVTTTNRTGKKRVKAIHTWEHTNSLRSSLENHFLVHSPKLKPILLNNQLFGI